MNPWLMIWLAVCALAAGLMLFGIFAYVTRRDVGRVDGRLAKIEDTHTQVLQEIWKLGTSIRQEIGEQGTRQFHSAERRSTALHNRINPVVTNLSEFKGMMEAFTQSFNNFTEIITHGPDRTGQEKEKKP